MNNKDEEIHHLLLKYREGKCTSEEIQHLYQIYNLASKSVDNFKSTDELNEIGNEIWNRLPISKKQQNAITSKYKITALFFYKSAAAILIFALLGGLLYLHQNRDAQLVKVFKPQDLVPGRNAATLTLSNGKKVLLSNITNENLSEQDGISIVKKKSGQLIYQVEAGAATSNVDFNTLSTGNGQQYQVKLPDGTMVWLNAGSSLTYPTLFTNTRERVVVLKGEAYFGVASTKDFNGRKNPFIVQTDRELVKVLGTHFNVSSYHDEAEIKTTLLEGSIELTIKSGTHEKIILKPQQQSSLNLANDHISVKSMDDAESEIAWKQGLFHFDHTEIKAVMRGLARWYNVDIVYKGNMQNASFTGEMYKSLSASKVLEGLRYTGLHFMISEHRITVTN